MVIDPAILNRAILNDEIKEFKKGLKKPEKPGELVKFEERFKIVRLHNIASNNITYCDNCKTCSENIENGKCKIDAEKDKDKIHPAIVFAYNDAARTMTGISNDSRLQKMKICALSRIEAELRRYFDDDAPNSSEDNDGGFDKEHKKLCKIWCDTFEDEDKKRGTELSTYGKAQKIVNMAFKYLYCCDDAHEEKHDHFKFCHLPLDSFTLTWFSRDVKENISVVGHKKPININNDYKWSKIKEKNVYDTIQKEISDYLNNTIKGYTFSPLEMEFIVWPEIQRHLAAEEFLSSLKGEFSADDLLKMPLKDKYILIRETLSERINTKPHKEE